MAERRRALKEREREYDIEVEPLSEEGLGGAIAQHLAVKGFCVLAPGLCVAVAPERARAEAEELEFHRVNACIAEGLLGPEGSTQVADVEPAGPGGGEGKGGSESLKDIDNALTRLWYALGPYAEYVGVEMTHRSDAVVHRTGEAEDETPPLTEKEVTKWQSQFLRQRLMLVTFLGPKTGALELQPFDQEDTEPLRIRTVPGSVVILRADTMMRRHSASGEALAVSCFLLAGVDKKGVPAGRIRLTPAAKKLEEWTVARLQELKGSEDQENLVWDPEIPRGWQAAMNHSYHRGQVTGVGGDACHFPTTYDADAWFRATTGGPDFASEVPYARWNHHDFYDPEPQSYLKNKTFCTHGVFMEGIELFDNKFFSLSPHESKGLDPQARLLLEVGYCALANMGHKKKDLMNSAGGVYVGCTSHEWSFCAGMAPTGGCSGVLCMLSGRISFCLGMKGPSISLSTEAASGLTAALLAAESVQQKGSAVGNDFAIGIGVHVLLSPVSWPGECMAGWLSPEGRCMTFDASASGYIRGDGCACIAVKNTGKVVDGEIVKNETDYFLGTIAGGMMSSSGQSASMSAPSSAAEQQVVADAIRNACVSHSDVDGAEVHGCGGFLSDAIEVSALWRAHRSEMDKDRLALSAVKSSIGNQVECAGITSLLKIMHAAQWGHMSPNLHLKQANPHTDVFEQPVDILTENLEFPFRSTFNGVKARGLGGSNVYILAWGSLASEQHPAPEPAEVELQRLPVPAFWPGGGGELEEHMQPRRRDGYFIAGTWSRWQDPQQMEAVGDGMYAYTMTLGENRWDKFQIWLDGDPRRALHPGEPKVARGSSVQGPDEGLPLASAGDGLAPTWMIDGRPWGGAAEEPAAAPGNPDAGLPGDQYRVRLEVAGRWRMVSWEKVRVKALEPVPTSPVAANASYYVAGSWNDWELMEMDKDGAAPGLFSLEVTLPAWGGGAFQIVRDADWDQVFYPQAPGSEAAGEVLGPDDQSMDAAWTLEGVAGQVFRIEFQRTVESGADHRRVSWRRLDPVK